MKDVKNFPIGLTMNGEYVRDENMTLGVNIFVSVSNIVALITALTAFKVRRHDLIRVLSTFINFSI